MPLPFSCTPPLPSRSYLFPSLLSSLFFVLYCSLFLSFFRWCNTMTARRWVSLEAWHHRKALIFWTYQLGTRLLRFSPIKLCNNSSYFEIIYKQMKFNWNKSVCTSMSWLAFIRTIISLVMSRDGWRQHKRSHANCTAVEKV